MATLEQNMERIATALESAAKSLEVMASNSKFLSGLSSKGLADLVASLEKAAHPVMMVAAPAAAAPAAAPAPAPGKPAGGPDFMAEAAPAAPAQVSPGKLPAPDDREGIKAVLDARKITYNPRLQTKTLYEMMIGETQAAPVSEAVKPEVLAAAAGATRPRPTPSGPADGSKAPVALTPVAPVAKEPTADEIKAAMQKFGHVYGNDKALALLNDFGVENLTGANGKRGLMQSGRVAEFMDHMKKKGEEYDLAAKTK